MSYCISFFISFLISLFLTPIVRKLCIRFDFVDYPKKDRWHKKPTAILGGIAIFMAVFVSLIFLFKELLNYEYITNNPHSKEFGLIIGVGSVFLLGLFDDIYHIKPQIKLLGQIIIAAVVVYMGIKIEMISSPFISIPLTILWIVGITNAFNLLDNMDGLSSGVAFIGSGILFIYTYLNGDSGMANLALILSGAALGFLIYNFYPSSIFMGDSGSMTLGFCLSCIALMGTWQHASNLLITMLVPVMILVVPIFDTTFVSLTRKIHGRPISAGGKDHTSHRLVSLGLSERKAVFVLFAISLAFGGVVVLGTWLNIFLILIIALVSGVVLFFFGVFLGGIQVYETVQEDQQHEEDRVAKDKTLLNAFIYNKKRIAEVLIDLILISVAYIGAYLLRFGGVIYSEDIELIKKSLPIIIVIKFSYFFLFGLYKSEWKYAGLNDLVMILKGTILSSLTIMAYAVLVERLEGFSRSVFIIDWLLSVLLLSGSRISLRIFREHIFTGKKGKPVLIFGAGDSGELLLREIKKNNMGYNPVGFIDDKRIKVGLNIHGVPVLGTSKELETLIKENNIEEVIIAIKSPRDGAMQRIKEICQKSSIRFSKVSTSIDIHVDRGEGLN